MLKNMSKCLLLYELLCPLNHWDSYQEDEKIAAPLANTKAHSVEIDFAGL